MRLSLSSSAQGYLGPTRPVRAAVLQLQHGRQSRLDTYHGDYRFDGWQSGKLRPSRRNPRHLSAAALEATAPLLIDFGPERPSSFLLHRRIA